MVGVPGRSKACHTCKRRKRGCDHQQPSCGQCLLSNLQCEGYDKQRIFVNSNQEHGDASTDRFTPQTYSALLLVQSNTQIQNTQIYSEADAALLSVPISSVPQKSLERSALETKYFEAYWSTLLPNGEAFSPRALQYGAFSWTNIVQDLCQKDDLVRFALLASATGLMGLQSGQRSLVMEGWRMYGQALKVLANSLPAVSLERSNSLHLTCKLLAQYELLQATTSGNESGPAPTWLRHVGGEAAIVSARNPEEYAEGYAHQLFVDCRLYLVYPNIASRTRSIFSLPDWKTIPWSLQAKDPKDELGDILVEIPAILEEFYALELNSVQNRISRVQQLEEECWLYDSQLQSWASTSGSPTIAFIDANTGAQNEENPEPSSEDFAIAFLAMVYLTTCCYLYYHMWRLLKEKQQELPPRIYPNQYCRKIVLLIPYFQSPGMGALFMNLVSFPVGTALRFMLRLGSPPDQLELLRKSFGGRHGPNMKKFFETWPWRSESERDFVVKGTENLEMDCSV